MKKYLFVPKVDGVKLKNRCQFSENKTIIQPDLKNVKGEKNIMII